MAKAKKQPEENAPTPKKKRSVASYKRKRKARSNPSPAANPPALSDITHVFLPGFAAYGGVRVLQRIVFQLVGKRWPKWAKWAHMATGLGAFGALYGFAHRVKALAPFHDSVLMGSGIAAAQGVAGALLPVKYSWLLSDCRPEDVKPSQQQAPAMTASQIQRSNDEYADADNDEYAALEAQLGSLAGGPARAVAAPKPKQNPIASNLNLATQGQSGGINDPDLLEELGDEALDDLYAGAFSMN